MKANLLVTQNFTRNGKSTVILRDINGGDGASDFRAGSPDGKFAIDIYGDASFFTVGGTYTLDITPFVEPEVSEAQAAQAAVTPAAPVVTVINAQITVTNDNGEISLGIAQVPAAAPVEDNTNTQGQAAATDTNTGNDQAAVGAFSANTAGTATGQAVAAETTANAATNTQAGPGTAGAINAVVAGDGSTPAASAEGLVQP